VYLRLQLAGFIGGRLYRIGRRRGAPIPQDGVGRYAAEVLGALSLLLSDLTIDHTTTFSRTYGQQRLTLCTGGVGGGRATNILLGTGDVAVHYNYALLTFSIEASFRRGNQLLPRREQFSDSLVYGTSA
jgi:hypothetical protein